MEIRTSGAVYWKIYDVVDDNDDEIIIIFLCLMLAVKVFVLIFQGWDCLDFHSNIILILCKYLDREKYIK
jgi:hypothetical protein